VLAKYACSLWSLFIDERSLNDLFAVMKENPHALGIFYVNATHVAQKDGLFVHANVNSYFVYIQSRLSNSL